jgi:hypothetical protein
MAKEVGAVPGKQEVDPSSAAEAAAAARQTIAQKIKRLASAVEGEDDAKVIVLLANAYASLAAEPPRMRA